MKIFPDWARRTLPLFAAVLLTCSLAFSQSLITGDIAGAVQDPSGGVVSGANVTLKSLDTGAVQATKTSTQGSYRFSLLKPGRYSVSVAQPGFSTAERSIDVSVGQTVSANIVLEVGQTTQTIEVSSVAPLLNPDPANNTTFTAQEVALLPSAGGDTTNIAFTAPGVVVNAAGGYGNFTVNGLPATSNLFTVNGENNMDPYFNINNSGASNLTLGQNELQEVTVVTNAYGGQFGQLSGAQVTAVTKSGTNEFHGNAQWWWNGRTLNANDWFNNFYGVDRPFANANQYAASIGGPIIKNRTFFFANTEGLRFVLPVQNSVTIPTQAFANAVIANVQAKQPAEAPTYQKMFSLYLNAPGSSAAQALPNTAACKSLVLPGFNANQQNCAARYDSTGTQFGQEWIMNFKIDHRFNDKDTIFYRYKLDHGLQPTYLDLISPNFNALSSQPAYDHQLNYTHIFSPTLTNNLLLAGSHYVAQFAQNTQLALSTFPYRIVTSGTVPFTGFNPVTSFPQGRNITQYQAIDDMTWTHGTHSVKFGLNWRHYNVADHNFFFNYPGVYFGYTSNGLQNFANGLGYQYRKSLNFASDVPVIMGGIGFYIQDEWAVLPRLKVTVAARFEHSSNPVCNFNCFANFVGPWSLLPSVTSSNPGTVPYSSDIAPNNHQAFQGLDAINFSPRVGFSWSPFKDGKTVFSGGFGIFYDSIPAGLVDDLLANPPISVAIRVRPSSGVAVFDPNGGAATWQASANAFNLSKTYKQIASQLSALGSSFSAPAFTSLAGTFHTLQSQQWNLMIQRQLTNSIALTVNYVGNHSIHVPYSNGWSNAYDQYGVFPGPTGNGIAGVPTKIPVPNYATVTTVQTGAVSHYNGLTVSVRKSISHGLTAHFNYTWSHAIDEVSNGGIFTYGDSVLGQINPLSLRANNYGNADYDIRHNFTMDWVYSPKFDYGNKFVRATVNGWQLSGKMFWRSGLPFSVSDGNSPLGNGGGAVFAFPNGGKVMTGSSCGAAAATVPCINASAFIDSGADSFNGYNSWSPQTRNQFRSAGYFDTDMALFKNIAIRERYKLGIGVTAFNVFNHPNFGIPDATLGDATFGQVTGTAGTPTSPYGVGLGYNAAPRTVQLTAKFTF